MSKNSGKKSAEAKRLAEILSSPAIGETILDDAPVNNILDNFINSDHNELTKQEEPAIEIETKVETIKLKDVPKKYWKFQTV